MRPHMSVAELQLFESLLRCSGHYMEFGAGGSTCLAAELVGSSVVSVDSSAAWLATVQAHCAERQTRLTPHLIHADIGPLGEWGRPEGTGSKAAWPGYHARHWREPAVLGADLYMVDGRFRVACFMQIVLHCEPDALIAIHDFASRPHYQVVRAVGREIARAEDLSVFQPLRGKARLRALEILEEYEANPD